MNKNIEVEGGEIAIRNSHGDLAIIPKDKINWVKQKLSEGCHDCIDGLVETLPIASQYAQDGSLFPNGPEPITLISPEGRRINTTTDDEFYRMHYNSKMIGDQNEDKSWNLKEEIFQESESLPEITVNSKIVKDSYGDYKNQFLKTNPSDKFYSQREQEHNKKFYSAPLWAQQVVGGYNEERKQSDRKRDEEDYNKLQNNFIAEKLLNRNKRNDNETRPQWLQRFSDKELEVIKNSDYKPKIEPSIWSKFEQGLLSIGNAGSPVTFKNENLTKEEAKQEDNPLNILQPLSIPTKMVQSAYKDDYSFTDALKGKQNNAGIVEDIVTDPLNLVGVGLAGKLSKADKAIDATKAGSKVLNKKEGLNKIDNILQESNQLPEPPHEIILDQPSNYIETINLKRQGVKNNKIMPSFDDVDLGNDLTLRNNPSRVINKNDILGKNRALVSVKNKKTNEYIDLKSWEDEAGKIYYYMSASMPSSKIKAGRAYMELEKHIPKGESLLENSSLSYDSFLNILKQTKNPKFETFVKGRIPMNDMAVSNKLKSIGNRTSDSIDLGFYNKELADNAVNELNILIDKYNLPKATVIKRTVSTQPAAHLPYEKKDIFEIELPNIGLKKLYSIIGLTSAGAAIQSQNQNKSEQ